MFVAAAGLVWTAITISGSSSQACGSDSAGGRLSAIAPPLSTLHLLLLLLVFPAPLSNLASLPVLSSLPLPPVASSLLSSAKVAGIASVPPQLRPDLNWFSILSGKVITASDLFQRDFKKAPRKAVKTRCSCASVLVLCGASVVRNIWALLDCLATCDESEAMRTWFACVSLVVCEDTG